MVVLALETVTRRGSIALWQEGQRDSMTGDAGRTHGERLPGELLSWLRAHGRSMAEVDVFAVVIGPGSFTGLRIGLAAMQGLTLAGRHPVVGIPTLDAMVAAWRLQDAAPAVVVACLDGQRGDVFCAAIAVTGERVELDACPRVLDPCVVKPEEAAAAIARLAPGRRVVLVGDGAARYADAFAAALPEARFVESDFTIADGAAELAAAHPDRAGAPHALRPFYLRATDVELARRRAERARPFSLTACAIRRAGSTDDVLAVQALQQTTFTNPWGADAIRWELENTDVARLYVMTSVEGQLLAYCACWMVFDELHINSFAVDPAWRRRGVARHLLQHVLAESVAAGARSATLEVRESNVAARMLYEGLGFRVEGTRRDYYQEPREDALILWNRAVG